MPDQSLIDNVRKAAKDGGKELGSANALAEFAILLGALSQEQAEAAKTMERQTNKLIGLTWGLLFLTAVLALSEIAHYRSAGQSTKCAEIQRAKE